jgi:hypothetical protein
MVIVPVQSGITMRISPVWDGQGTVGTIVCGAFARYFYRRASGLTFSAFASLARVASCTLLRFPVSSAAIVARPTPEINASSIWVRPRRLRCSFKRDNIMNGLFCISIAVATQI